MEKSNTIPVHKRGDNLLLENYRPSQVNMGLEKRYHSGLISEEWKMSFVTTFPSKLTGSGS